MAQLAQAYGRKFPVRSSGSSWQRTAVRNTHQPAQPLRDDAQITAKPSLG